MISIGQTIPEMQLEAYQNEDIRKINLSDYRGKWLVMLFYPADFTYICPIELESQGARFEISSINEKDGICSCNFQKNFLRSGFHCFGLKPTSSLK